MTKEIRGKFKWRNKKAKNKGVKPKKGKRRHFKTRKEIKNHA